MSVAVESFRQALTQYNFTLAKFIKPPPSYMLRRHIERATSTSGSFMRLRNLSRISRSIQSSLNFSGLSRNSHSTSQRSMRGPITYGVRIVGLRSVSPAASVGEKLQLAIFL
jgi:hypothetical protein